MKPLFKYYGPAILWALFILVICAIPLGKAGGSPLFFPGFDKVVHCCLFVVLAVLYSAGSMRKWATRNLSLWVAVKCTIIMISFGALIETLQMYVFTWRSGDTDDLLADTIGACVGILSVLITANAVNHEKN